MDNNTEQNNTEKTEDLEKFEGRQPAHQTKDDIIIVPGSPPAPLPALPEESFFTIIERLTSQGADPDTIEKFMNMQERILDRDAKQAFNLSMTRAQSQIDVVIADSWSKQTESRYAKLKKILKDIKPIYTSEGFSLMYYELETSREGQKKIGVDIMHSQGHTEKRFGYFSIQTTGIAGRTMMTQIHGEGSTISYGRRYLTCMIFNVPVGDDDDGVAAGAGEDINETQLETIKGLIKTLNVDEAKFLEFLGKAVGRTIEAADKIPADEFDRAMKELGRKKKKAPTKEGSDG